MMKSFIRFIKRIFGVYETGYEYWVYLRDIKISPDFKKLRLDLRRWVRNGVITEIQANLNHLLF